MRTNNQQVVILLSSAAHLRALLLVISCLLASVFPASATETIQFKKISLSDQRSQTDVLTMAEDDKGYLWLGTFQGLLRYDGLSSARYNHNEDDKHSLSNNLIRKVHVSNKGELWIGTQSGLNRYSEANDSFDRFLSDGSNPQVIWGVFESPTGELLVSTNTNLYRWQANTESFSPLLPSDSEAIELKSLHFVSKSKAIAASYENGLFAIDLKTGTVEAHPSNVALKQNRTQLYQLTQIENAKFWLSSSHGVYQLNLHTNALAPHPSKLLAQKPIRSIYKANNGTIWAGSEKQILQSSNGQDFTVATQVNRQVTSSSSVFVYDILEDHYGNIWFGGPDLLAVRHASADMYQQNHLGALSVGGTATNIKAVATTDHSVWLLTSTGILARWDPLTKTIYEQTQLEINASLNNHFRLVYDQFRKLLWIGAHEGLFSFSPATREIEHHNIEINQQPLSREFSFKVDSEGQVWIASKHYGLIRYTPDSKQLNRFPIPSQFNDNLTAMEVGASTILLGTEKGLLEFYPSSQTFKQLDIEQLNQKWITTIEASGSVTWVGTLQAGAFRTDESFNQLERFDISKGLTDNTVCDVVLSNRGGYAWIVSNFGISQVQPQHSTVATFTSDNGLYTKEFNHQATSISEGGIAYIGGVDGLTSFDVNQAIDINYRGQVQLTQLRVFNQVVPVNGPHKRLAANIRSLPLVNLLYNDSPFSIEFSYPAPAHSESFHYAYRLVGLDDKWLSTDDNKPRATYTNLSPGQFTFEVKALSSDGLWQSEPTRLTVQIAPPMWRTPPAYLAYAIVIIIVLMLIAKQRQLRREQQLKVIKSEERLKLSLWGSGDELWDWHITTGKIYRSNIWGLLEFPHDGRRSPHKGQQSNIHPRDLKRVQNALSNHFDGRTTFYEATYRVRNKSADWIWILDRGKIVERDTDDNPLRMTGTIKDISKLKQAEERLTLFARSVANISDGVFILNRRFRIVEINEAFSQITGFSKAQVMNRSLHFRSYPNSFSAQVKVRLAQQGRWVGELEELRANGEPFFVELTIDPIHSEEGDVSHYVGVFSDITRRKQTEQELHRLSVEDTLTKLPNRSWFQAEHEKLVAKQTRHALMVLDLDNFKKINDSLGHVAGDELLQQVSIRLNHCTRRQDTLFRLGGDEYAVLMESTTDINTITRAAKALQKSLEAPFAIAERELVVTCSVGIVLYPLDGETSEELLRNADTAMYHAKSEGSNRYVFFSSQMNQSALHQLHLESLLRQAIRDDSFQLHYQPKFSSQTGELDGMEALIRLHHPEHGPISPGEFIPLAEDNGLIIEIGDIVLRKACFAAESWRRQGLMKGRIAVNVSAKQFSSPTLPDRIKSALELTGLPAHFLELELTEGALIADPEGAISVMEVMQEIGIHISLDDFGTGYSSLAYLQRFPIDTLKIDQTFVRNLTTSSSGRNMVASIVALAHNMNLTVVAEGVETEQERDILTELNCETLQGYLMSRPLNETDFSAFLHIQSNQENQSASEQPEFKQDYQAD